MWTDSSAVDRARVHAALGDPSRLAIIDWLLLGDLSPGEIADGLGLAGNLIAHHLNMLTRAGLVERVRSEADRRRAYVRLIPAPLSQLTAGGRLSAPRVVFVCTHNSARSQLAVAAWGRVSAVPVASAGTRPAERVHPGAVAAGRRHQLRMRSPRTAHIDSVLRPDDLVVAVCDNAHEELGDLAADRLHWSIPDPVRDGTDAAFDTALELIQGRIGRLATAVHTPQETR